MDENISEKNEKEYKDVDNIDEKDDKNKIDEKDEKDNKDEEKKKNKKEKKGGKHQKDNKDKKDKKNQKGKKDKNDKKDEKNKKAGKISASKIVISVCLIIALVEGAYGGYLLFEKYKKKFKSIEVEIGTTEKVTMNDFLKDSKYAENSQLITNLDEVDYSKVGQYQVVLKHEDREEEVTLKLIDTTPPEVKFKNIDKYIDYKIVADDFIEEKTDLSEMTTEVIEPPELNEFKDYDVNIVVKDKYGNETTNVCKLSIKWIKDEFLMEKGHVLTKEDLLYNAEIDSNLIDANRLKEISNSPIGDYQITTNKDGIEKVTTVKITDLTPPTLTLKNVTIYDDEKISGKEAFIVSATDASGEVTTTMKTQINYSKLGTQEIVIEAVDKYNNKTEATAILTRQKDTVGPVISGLSTITVRKGTTINYEQGVSAKDAKDGVSSFTVDSSSVNTSVAGTYYATYTSSDTKGNKTTTKRKIVVNHDQADVDALVKSIASGLSSNVEQIRDYCRNKITYGHSYGDGDPIWYGFNNWTGNCYVHAECFQALLRAKGYETQMIWVTNKTHYWNLVKINGVWRHMDSTPDRNHRKISIMTDEQRLSTLSGRDWDHSAWPAAN